MTMTMPFRYMLYYTSKLDFTKKNIITFNVTYYNSYFCLNNKYQKHDQIETGHITKPGKKVIPVTYNIYYNFCFGSYQLELIS